jgi:hypothetical protein
MPEHQGSSRPMPAKVLDGNNRQTALTPEVMARLCKELSVGDWPTYAAYRAGISPSTMSNWLRMGCLPDAVEPYTSLIGAVVTVEAELSERMMRCIIDSATGEVNGNPESAKWVLQNRFRWAWGIDKETGKAGGRSIAEEVEALMFQHDADRREKARAILAAMSHDQKQAARKEGFLV